MSNMDWAKREIDIACRRERKNAPVDKFDYGCACYESALKAFKCLCEDDHSGMSIGFTKTILNRLIDGKPLTPIEDTDDEFTYVREDLRYGEKVFQSRRMSSFFKYLRSDGSAYYHDIGRAVGIDINSDIGWFYSNTIDEIVDALFPITMPYWPDGDPIKVYLEYFLTDSCIGDYDTRGILYLIHPSEGRLSVNRYFKYDDNQTVEIGLTEYLQRKEIAEERLRKLYEI